MNAREASSPITSGLIICHGIWGSKKAYKRSEILMMPFQASLNLCLNVRFVWDWGGRSSPLIHCWISVGPLSRCTNSCERDAAPSDSAAAPPVFVFPFVAHVFLRSCAAVGAPFCLWASYKFMFSFPALIWLFYPLPVSFPLAFALNWSFSLMFRGKLTDFCCWQPQMIFFVVVQNVSTACHRVTWF